MKKTLVMLAKSATKAWTTVHLPCWMEREDFADSRAAFHAYQKEHRGELGYVPRTHAWTWIEKNRPEWAKRALQDFDKLMLTYALCLLPGSCRFEEWTWEDGIVTERNSFRVSVPEY